MNYPTSPRKDTSSVSKLTVEYLKKFGQNRDLQQYFVLSTPLAISEENLPQIETKIPQSILTGSKKGPLWSDLNLPSTSRTYDDRKTPDMEHVDTGRLSSASSIMSDKRLEWDSGADVGYVNYYNNKHREKSISLPTLSTIESSGENSTSSHIRKTKKQTTFAVSTPATNSQTFFKQNESEITAIPKEKIEENLTPTKSKNKTKVQKSIESENSTISKEKYEENLTPKKSKNKTKLQKDKSISLEDTRLKPEILPKKTLSQTDLPNIEKSSIIENMYIFSPTFIKNLKDKKGSSKTSDKIVQTTLEKVKKSFVDTESDLYETARNNDSSISKTAEKYGTFTKSNQRIQIPTSSSFEYIPGNKYKSTNSDNDSSTPITKSDNEIELLKSSLKKDTFIPEMLGPRNEVPASSSFEFIPGIRYKCLENNDSSTPTPKSDNEFELLKSSLKKINTSDKLVTEMMDPSTSYTTTTNSEVSNQESSGRSIGSILMGSQYSTNLTKDLEHTVNAMRDIIEAKQYTESDKKRLIRKIVKKIVNTNYDEDEENPIDISEEILNKNANSPSTPSSNHYSENNGSPEIIDSSIVIKSVEIPEDKIIHDVVKLEKSLENTAPTDEKVTWKNNITFSEKIFAERIKYLQNQRQLRDNRKKKRNIFTNVGEFQKKIVKDVVERGGDTISNVLDKKSTKKLLKITEKERENHLEWIKSEMYHLNQLRLLLEENSSFPPQISSPTQVYTLFSSCRKKVTSNSTSDDSDTYTSSQCPPATTSINASGRSDRTDTSRNISEIDRIIQRNYILTESTTSKKCEKPLTKTDRDLQSKIIANIKDAQTNEIWKMDPCPSKRKHKSNFRYGRLESSFRAQISEDSDISTTKPKCYTELDCNSCSGRNQSTNSKNSERNKYSSPTSIKEIGSSEKHSEIDRKSKQNVFATNPKSFNETNRRIKEQESVSSDKKDSDRKSKQDSSDLNKKFDEDLDYYPVGEREIYSKHKNKSEQIKITLMNCRDSFTQTSGRKTNSTSSEEYICKCYKSVKVDKQTQTCDKDEGSDRVSTISERCYDRLRNIGVENNPPDNSHKISVECWGDISTSHTYVNENKLNNDQNRNAVFQPPSSPIYLNLNEQSSPFHSSGSNSHRCTCNKISSLISRQNSFESDTNRVCQKPTTYSSNKTSELSDKSKNHPQCSCKNPPKFTEKIHDPNFVPYSTWPPNAERNIIRNKFLPKSDRNQREISKIRQKNRVFQSHASDAECCIHKKTVDCQVSSQVANVSPRHHYSRHTESSSKSTSVPNQQCRAHKLHPELPNSSSFEVRNISSPYSTNYFTNKLPESISHRSQDTRMSPSREFSEHPSSKESSQNYGTPLFHVNSTHSSHYSKTSSEIMINCPSVSNNSVKSDNPNIIPKCSCVRLYDVNTGFSLHKKIQAMLNRCETCSKHKIERERLPEIEHCTECYCHCLNSNRQQERIDTCTCRENMPLCNTCKLNQERYRQNSIAYFLRIESRDDLMIEESPSSTTHRHTEIDEVKIYVPKFMKRGSNIVPNINAKYVEEIGLNRESVQTLKDYLLRNRPEFIHAADNRQQYLREVAVERNKNVPKKLNRQSNSEARYKVSPKKKRMFSSNKIKEMTIRKYRTLPEVEQKRYSMKMFQQRRTNRLMMELFNKKLQQKVHKGQMDLSLTKTLL